MPISLAVRKRREFFDNLTADDLENLAIDALQELFTTAPKLKPIRVIILEQIVAIANRAEGDLHYEYWHTISQLLLKGFSKNPAINRIRKQALEKNLEAERYRKYSQNKIIHTRAVHHNSFRGALKSTLTT